MSVPVQIYAPNGQPARQHLAFAQNNSLFQTATQTKDRKRIPALDMDVHRTVTTLGRRTMMTLGHNVYANFHPIRGAINEKAEYASSIWLPQYYGANKDWGISAEAWMEQHDKICDIAGPPYNMRLYRLLLLICLMREGDMLTVLVKTPGGYPLLQCIPGHRVSSNPELLFVRGGQYDGARIIDGVILDEYSRALAYRVNTGENPYDYTKFTDISSGDSFLSFIPLYRNQLRGFSPLGMIAFSAQDVGEGDLLKRLSDKLASSISLIEKNELGEAMGATNSDGQLIKATAADPVPEELVTDGGITVRYLTADPNHSITPLTFNNPTQNQMEHRHSMLRDMFAGIDWSIDFSLDPTKAGGAQMRVVIDKINRGLTAIQDLALTPACGRIDPWRVASAIELKLLEDDPDWFMWMHQGPARLTADAKYESDVDKQEVANAFKTRRQAIANRGGYIDDVNREVARDSEEKWKMAANQVALVKKLGHDIDITTAYNALWNEQPNGITQQPQKDDRLEREAEEDRKAGRTK